MENKAFQHAIHCLRASKFSEAKEILNRLWKDFPEDPAVLHGMAVAAAGCDESNEARRHFEQALAISPARANAIYDFGCFLLREGDDLKALEMFLRLTRLTPDDPKAWYHVGFMRVALGDSSGAEDAFNKCLSLAPSFGQAVAQLARLRRDKGDYVAALALFEAVSRKVQANAELFHLWWQFCSMSALPSHSSVAVESGLSKFPMDPDLNIDAATVAEEQGRRDSALRLYSAALALDPNRGLALGNLLGLLGAKADDALVARGREVMNDHRARSPARAIIGYGLAKVLHEKQHFAEAFAVVSEANRARSEEAGSLDRQKIQAQRVRLLLMDDLFRSMKLDPRTETDISPLLIVGMPRTGTTLVEQIIASADSVSALGELPDLPIVADKLAAHVAGGLEASSTDKVKASLETGRDHYLKVLNYRVGKRSVPRCVAIDKFPLNVWNVGIFLSLYPDAKVIWCRRNIADVCLSIFFENFAPSQKYATSLNDLVYYYHAVNSMMLEWSQRYPGAIWTCVYEDLVDRPEALIREMVDFVEVPWSDKVLAHHQSTRAVQTPSRWQVRQPINRRGIGKWQVYLDHLQPYL